MTTKQIVPGTNRYRMMEVAGRSKKNSPPTIGQRVAVLEQQQSLLGSLETLISRLEALEMRMTSLVMKGGELL